MHEPEGEDWLGLSSERLPTEEALAWATRPDCGAVVVFAGNVRDHADGRDGVTALTYEAYDDYVVPRLRGLAGDIRHHWPEVGRIALLHRTGRLGVGETAVVVVVSAAHRAEAFDAARFGIDELKATIPIWKQEFWQGGAGWGTGGQPVREQHSVGAGRAH